MDLSELRKIAKEFGLVKLSKKTGLARSYLYKVVDGSSSPTIEAFAKILNALGYNLEIQRKPLPDSVFDVSKQVALGGSWKIHFFNFVDAFRRSKNTELIKEGPVATLSEKEMALLSSIVVELCFEFNMDIPLWARTKRTLKEPWFVAGFENLKALAIAESPASFKRNNIFVLDNFLARA